MRSLRARLIAVALLSVAAAVALTAILSRRVVSNELKHFVLTTRPARLDGAAKEIAALGPGEGAARSLGRILERNAATLGHGLVLVEAGGRIAASSAPALQGGRVTEQAGGEILLAGADQGPGGSVAIALRNPPRLEVRDASGRALGTLIALPERGPRTKPDAPFLASVSRGLWLGAGISLLLAAGLMWMASKPVVRPIEALTRAAERLRAGDLGARVEVEGDDEVARLSRSFNAMAESVARSRANRRRLAQDLAHELRTPLSNLRGQVEALQDGLQHAGAAAYQSLHEEVMLLARLVEDLRQLSEAESDSLVLERRDVAVDGALRAAAGAVAARAAERGVSVRVDAAAGTRVHADPERLAQVLRALLENSLQHTPPGGEVRLASREDAGGAWFVVADTGEGIAPEHLPHIFERFYRADPARSRATGGSGLGLAIARHLVEAHGGQIRAESAAGGGTTVSFHLPGA